MIKEALAYVVGLSRPELVETEDGHWSDRKLTRVSYNPKADAVRMSTLTSLVDYIKSGVDEITERMIIHVVSPLEVRLFSQLDPDRRRETLVMVVGNVPEFKYGSYMGHEEFLIALQSKFQQGNDRDLLLRFAGTVENGTLSNYGDDGVTQKATVSKGIASKEQCIVPNPVHLQPFRTFVEVDQPESAFVFRMRDDGRDGVQCAIFEADGGAWKNEAMENIRAYLQDELAEFGDMFTVIS